MIRNQLSGKPAIRALSSEICFSEICFGDQWNREINHERMIFEMKMTQDQLNGLIESRAEVLLHKKMGKVLYDPNLSRKLPFQGVNEAYDTDNLSDKAGFKNVTEFLRAIKDGDHSKLAPCRVEKTGMEVGTPSEGGFLLPDAFKADLIEGMQNVELIRPRATVWKIPRNAGDSITVPGIADDDYSSDECVKSYWKAEKAEYEEQTPALNQISMKLHKVTCLIRASEELLFGSAINAGQAITKIMANSMSYALDKAFLSGNGSGQPLGILSGLDLLTASKADGQDAGSLVFDNIADMAEKLNPNSWNNAIWISSISNLKNLLKMSLPIGTGGSQIPVMSTLGGKFNVLGKDLFFSQHMNRIGSEGSLLLADLRKYVIVQRDDFLIRSDTSTGFKTDEVYFKMTFYCNAQPIYGFTRKLADGVTEVASFVQMGEVA